MSSLEQLNDFAKAWVGSNLLDRCVEEVCGTSMRGSEECLMRSSSVDMVGGFLRSREIALPSVGYDADWP